MDKMKVRIRQQPFKLHSEEAQTFFRHMCVLFGIGEIYFSEIFTATVEYLLGLPEHPMILHDIDQLLQIEDWFEE